MVLLTVYIQYLRGPISNPVKVPALTDVAEIDVLDDYGFLVVLLGASCVSASQLATNCNVISLEGQAIAFPLDTLKAMDPLSGPKNAKRISSVCRFSIEAYVLGGSNIRLRCINEPTLEHDQDI